MKRPDFSPLARQYAKTRPGYPDELFDFLASVIDRHDLAWDCATGNGQAAVGLAERFRRVVATDISEQQIKHAKARPSIEYRVAPSEASGLEESSVDLVTAATGIHWFDLDEFYAELVRVVRPGGVVSAWTYHVADIDPAFDGIFSHFYHDTLSRYFASGVKIVDDYYRSIHLPGHEMPAPSFQASASWDLEQMYEFMMSWSGLNRYIEVHGTNPIDLIAEDLERAWGDPKQVHTVKWPLSLRVARI